MGIRDAASQTYWPAVAYISRVRSLIKNDAHSRELHRFDLPYTVDPSYYCCGQAVVWLFLSGASIGIYLLKCASAARTGQALAKVDQLTSLLAHQLLTDDKANAR